MGILFQNTISKFSKTKNKTKKRPPKVTKRSKMKESINNDNEKRDDEDMKLRKLPYYI